MTIIWNNLLLRFSDLRDVFNLSASILAAPSYLTKVAVSSENEIKQ
jgi:hypothetical protein